jgi:glucose-1-phosphate cytidylyltransferase
MIEANQFMAFKHEGFWRPLDTLKDKQVLEETSPKVRELIRNRGTPI